MGSVGAMQRRLKKPDPNYKSGKSPLAFTGTMEKDPVKELTDARISDVIRWKEAENKIFGIESTILAVETGTNAGELLKVDYEENEEILSDQEQREKWDWELSKGIIDEADIMMQMNPDLNREEALEHLEERKIVPETTEGTAGNTLLDALAKPVE